MNKATSEAPAERLQKLLSRLGLGSRREAEAWIRAGRLTVNGEPAVLGMRVGARDQIRLDGRLVRARPQQEASVYLCHRSPGEWLLPPREGGEAGGEASSMAERLPRRAGRRFMSISPMPTVDGGLELLTADGALAARLQRAVHALPAEFSLRVRGLLSEQQLEAIRGGMLDRGSALRIVELEPAGGEASNRWYRLVAIGASGNHVRQLVERSAATLVRVLRTRLGALELPRALARGQFRALSADELSLLLDSPGSDP